MSQAPLPAPDLKVLGGHGEQRSSPSPSDSVSASGSFASSEDSKVSGWKPGLHTHAELSPFISAFSEHEQRSTLAAPRGEMEPVGHGRQSLLPIEALKVDGAHG